MPKARRTVVPPPARIRGETLSQRLLLLRFLHNEFGFTAGASGTIDVRGDEATKSLLEALRGTDEGYGSHGLSQVAAALSTRANKLVTNEELASYDNNIRQHLSRINDRRDSPLTLRYFQILALLYTERILDRLTKGPMQLC